VLRYASIDCHLNVYLLADQTDEYKPVYNFIKTSKGSFVPPGCTLVETNGIILPHKVTINLNEEAKQAISVEDWNLMRSQVTELLKKLTQRGQNKLKAKAYYKALSDLDAANRISNAELVYAEPFTADFFENQDT
jgi:hypothetical protein